MWPRSRERGNDVQQSHRHGTADDASMWPRSRERGNLAGRCWRTADAERRFNVAALT